MAFSVHFGMFAATGPPATRRGKFQLGKSVLHRVFGALLSVCASEMNAVGLDQQPSTAAAGLAPA